MRISQANVLEIAHTMRLFVRPGQLGEVRIIQPCGSTSGFYFWFDQIDAAAQLAATFYSTAKGIYIVMNEIDPATLDGRDTLTILWKPLTCNDNITRRQWLLIDCDPKREGKVSSTDAEKEAARAKMVAVDAFMDEQGWPAPIIGDSGNGFHLLHRIDLPSEDGGLVLRVLQVLASLFDDEAVSIDLKVANASRICKLYGTLAAKGEHTDERPHRLSGIITIPEQLDVVQVELLEKLAGEGDAQQQEPTQPNQQTQVPPRDYKGHSTGLNDTLDVERYLSRYGVQILNRDNTTDGAKRWFITCPNIKSHSTPDGERDCCITQAHDGKLGGQCFHGSCGMTSWQEIKRAIGAITRDDWHRDLQPLPPVNLDGLMGGGAAPTTSAEPVEDTITDVVPVIAPDLLQPGGLLQEIIDFNLRTAIKPQLELALAGAIALVATITGRKVEDDYGTRPNIYIVGIAPSGAGKDNARRVNKVLLAAAGAEQMLQDDLASSAGLHSAMVTSPSTLLQLDEFGRFLATLGNPSKSPHLYAIVSVLLKLYSSSNSLYLTPSYADAKKNKRIPFPNCVLYGTTVPASFYGSLTREALCDGVFNRLLIVEASNSDPDLQTPEPLDAPFPLVEAVRWWLGFNPGCTTLVQTLEQTARRLVTSPEAKEEFNRLDVTVRQRQREEEKRGTQVWGRCSENARKLALIHQCSLDREASSVGVNSARWGCLLALHLTTRVEQLAEAHVADGEFDKLTKKLLRFVREGAGRERTKTEVCRHMRSQKPRELEEIVNKLVSTEEITIGRRESKSGPSAIVYRAP